MGDAASAKGTVLVARADPPREAAAVENVRLVAGQLHDSLSVGEVLHADRAVHPLLKHQVTERHTLEHFIGVANVTYLAAVETPKATEANAADT